MKKVLAIVIMLSLLLLPGCAQASAAENEAPAEAAATTPAPAEGADASTVYFTSSITPEGMMAVYEALGWTPTGNVAVKLSTGEPPASNYLRPELISDLVDCKSNPIRTYRLFRGGTFLSVEKLDCTQSLS